MKNKLKKVKIENIRNIDMLEFELPGPGVHVLTGTNGSGKTTLFTCISRICNSNAYRLGFPSSTAKKNLDVFSGSITYSIDDDAVTYTKRGSGKWIPNKNSDILTRFGYPQIINIKTNNERVFYQDEISPRKTQDPDEWLNNQLNIIFDTNKFSSMVRLQTGDLRGKNSSSDGRRRNIAYAIPQGSNYYTEQNFSFGEIVTINLLHEIRYAQNNALLLIDELEMALHPSAQIRLINILEQLAKEKKLTILISTHSSSIIKSRKDVIFMAREGNHVNVLNHCPPAMAIGAIGMREDTNPDIIVLVEDPMAKNLFNALYTKYTKETGEINYLDIRVLCIGGFKNVVDFFLEAKNYVFYDNVYVCAFMDKDVETDILPYSALREPSATITAIHDYKKYLHFLPYTPEVLLARTFLTKKQDLLCELKQHYSNQQLNYTNTIINEVELSNYEKPLPQFANRTDYKEATEKRGDFRKRCKEASRDIATSLAQQLNIQIDEVYRFVFSFSISRDTTINIRELLAPTMKRIG